MIIVFNDNTQLLNIVRNGDIFLSPIPIYTDDYLGKTETVTLIGDDYEETLYNQKMINMNVMMDDKYAFRFETIQKEDLRYAQTRSDIEYIAMMADVDLGAEETL